MKHWHRVVLTIPIGLLMGWGGYVLLVNNPEPASAVRTSGPSTAPVAPPDLMLAAAAMMPPAARADEAGASTTGPTAAGHLTGDAPAAHDDLKAQLLAAHHAAHSTRSASPPQPQEQPSPQPVVPRGNEMLAQAHVEPPITMNEVEALGRRLAPLIEARFKRTPIELGEEKISVAMESARLVFEDGSPQPVAGEIIFRCAQSVRVLDKYASDSLDRYAIRLAREHGRWAMLSGTSRCESHSVNPKPNTFQSRVGRVVTLSPNWLREVLAVVNAGS
jgi:hypothetical protein